jgi:fructose-specific phosphotransferase system IIC component
MIRSLQDAALGASVAALVMFAVWQAELGPGFALGILAGAIAGVAVGWLTRLILRALHR